MVRRQSVDVFDSTVVAVDTDAGLTGWGEVCPLGPAYLPAYANGVRAGIAELGPQLLGHDPRELGRLNRRMDAALQGPPLRQVGDRHGLLGHPRQGGRPAGLHAAGRPLRRRLRALPRHLAGGARRAWRPSVAGYRAEGYRKFQLKVGGEPEADIARIRAVRRRAASPATGWWPTPTPAG